MEVAVAHELTSLRTRRGETEAIDDVVEAQLEEAQKLLTRDALTTRGLRVVIAELLLQHAVDARALLLLALLQQVFALLGTRATVLAGRVRAALKRAAR